MVARFASSTQLPGSLHKSSFTLPSHSGCYCQCLYCCCQTQPHCLGALVCLTHSYHHRNWMEWAMGFPWRLVQDPCGQGALNQVDRIGLWAGREQYPGAGQAGRGGARAGITKL